MPLPAPARRNPLARTDLGRLITDARRSAGLTQARLANAIGTSQSVISRWERGADAPRVDTLVRILQACGFEPDLVLRRHDDVDRSQLATNLGLTPAGRLRQLEGMHEFVQSARRAKRVPA